jgi:DNA-binding transcriptional regulator YhcF (GntR family)
MYQFKLNTNNGHRTKLKQLVHTIIVDIEKSVLKKDQQLPSVTGFSKAYGPFHVIQLQKAYQRVKETGIHYLCCFQRILCFRKEREEAKSITRIQ